MTNNGCEEWVQYYQQSVDPQAECVDSTIVTSMSSSNSIDQNATNPSSNNNNNNNNIIKSQSKPTRRRSRASKKTPATILNADTTNFRALVQHFTGCPSTSISFRPTHRRGPLNLSFMGFGREDQVVSSAEASLLNDYSYVVQVQHQARPPQQLQHQEQSEYASMIDSSFNGVTNTDDAFVSTMPLSSNFLDTTEDIFGGYPMDDLPFQV